MARSMAAMQQMLNSMTPEQRAQLQGLAQALLEDMDLRWQMDELSRNLQHAFPDMPWNQRQNFSGDDPMQFGQMSSCSRRSATSTSSRTCCSNATQPGQLAEVDIDQARDLLGEDSARSLERLPGAGEDPRGGRAHRPARGPVRAHAQGRARARPAGARRPVPQDDEGQGRPPRGRAGRRRPRARRTSTSPTSSATRSTSTSEQTVKNAIWRQGSGTPVRLSPEDFEVERTELLTRSATVLMLDVSLSMPMRDNFLAGQEGRDGAALAHHDAVPARLLRARRVRPRRPRGEAGAAARDELGLRVGHEHAARDDARPHPARARDRHQADHHGHGRRADRPHRSRRGGVPVPAVRDHDRGDAARGAALHARRASASTRSCSTRARTSRTSSRA